ncbi:MAG: threonine ammonia-lyase [Syntrophorhabdales bacterium]|jgi:threonine dehydratase
MVTLRDIETARTLVGPFIHRTPLFHSSSLSRITGADVSIKAENLQKTGSFKVRGAFSKMTRMARGKVVAASMGNHGQAVAFAARSLGMQSLIVMPKTVSIVKEEATRGYGAEVVLYGESFQEALDYALSLTDYTFIHAYDDDEVIAGQGTLCLEIVHELDRIDAVLVPVGGGGLIAGCAVAVKETLPRVRVIGVQADAAPSAFLSLRKGGPVSAAPLHTIADGIAVGRVGEKTFPLMKKYVDEILTVREDAIAMAILLLMERSKVVVEGAGAVPLAALMEHGERVKGKRVLLIASGGNIDPTLIDRMIYKGLLTSGRIVVFEVLTDDVPGSLQVLVGIIAAHGGNILNVVHDRLQADLPIGKTRVIFTVETRRPGHLEEIIEEIRERGYEARRRG